MRLLLDEADALSHEVKSSNNNVRFEADPLAEGLAMLVDLEAEFSGWGDHQSKVGLRIFEEGFNHRQ